MSVVAEERHIKDTPQNRQLIAVKKAEDLAVHTIKVCANKNIFIDKYNDLTKKIVSTAGDIYVNSFYANGIYVKNAETKEKRLQHKRETVCKKIY